MSEIDTINWKERLKEDTYFIPNLIMHMNSFHEETNGIPIRKRAFTKTFKQWLLKQKIGKFLLEEMEKRTK